MRSRLLHVQRSNWGIVTPPATLTLTSDALLPALHRPLHLVRLVRWMSRDRVALESVDDARG